MRSYLVSSQVHGQHTGAHLSTVLMEVLQHHGLINRVIAVTTDNASNNKTLVDSLHESMQSLCLPNTTQIVRIPCLAHVIQLSLKDLLGLLKVDPKNDLMTTIWSDDSDIPALRKAARQEGIVYTLARQVYSSLFY